MGDESWVQEAQATGALVPVDPMHLESRRPTLDKSRMVSILGTPRKRSDDPSKLILIPDPLSTHPTYYEVDFEDVIELEEELIITDRAGHSFPLVRAWFQEGTVCVRSELICLRRMRFRESALGSGLDA